MNPPRCSAAWTSSDRPSSPAGQEDQRARNEQFPFEPKDIKAVFLTHAHVDHNGRLPLLYKRGFRGPVYCTDATRDINEVMLDMSLGIGEGREDIPPLYDRRDLDGLLDAVEAVPYNPKLDRHGLTFRLTDADHVLGSAMFEVWADGVKFLFSGDTGAPQAQPYRACQEGRPPAGAGGPPPGGVALPARRGRGTGQGEPGPAPAGPGTPCRLRDPAPKGAGRTSPSGPATPPPHVTWGLGGQVSSSPPFDRARA